MVQMASVVPPKHNMPVMSSAGNAGSRRPGYHTYPGRLFFTRSNAGRAGNGAYIALDAARIICWYDAPPPADHNGGRYGPAAAMRGLGAAPSAGWGVIVSAAPVRVRLSLPTGRSRATCVNNSPEGDCPPLAGAPYPPWACGQYVGITMAGRQPASVAVACCWCALLTRACRAPGDNDSMMYDA